jgi:hypothetical protein
MNYQKELLQKIMSSETFNHLEEDCYSPLITSPKDSLYERGFKDGYNQALQLLK